MSIFYKWGSEKGDPASIVCDSMDMSLADLKLAIVDQRKIKNETDYDFLVTNSQTKEAYEDDAVLLPRNTTVHVARRPLPRGEKKIWRVNRAPVSSTIPIPEVAPEADDEESRLEEVLADSNNMYGRTNWTRVWKPRGPRALAGEKLQTENRYASGIPTSMLKPASGVEADGIDLSKKVTMTEVEREAYIQGKVESVDWLNDEEVEEKVPEQMEVPSELKCPFCGELLVAAVLLPCCVVAACDECARDMLINDDHICRLCKAGAAKKEDKVSPGDLIPNLRLRRKVFEFSNKTTGRVTSSSQAEEPRPASRPSSALEEAVLATITAQDFPSPDNLPVSDTPVPPDSTVTSQLECDSATSRPSSGQSGGGPPTPGQSGGPPTPGQSGGGPPTPGQSGGPPTPGQSGGGPPTPLEDERISPTPTSQPISTESLSVEPPAPETREEPAAEDASVTSEPPVPGEEGVGGGLERQESIHSIPTLSSGVPGVIQTTYNNSYNTYYTPTVWDGYQWVDHSAYQHDPYSVPPPGYGVYGEKVYNAGDADGRGKTFTYDERKERERWEDRDRRRGYGRRDEDRRDGYRNYDRKKDWDRGKGYRDSRDDDRYRRHRRRSEERNSRERRSEGKERNEARERRSEGKERNEARERKSEGKERNDERRRDKEEGRDKSVKKERVSKERSISRSRERSLEEERDRRKREYKDGDNGEEDKRDECASQVHDSSSEDIEKEVKRKKLKDLKETLKRKAEEIKEGKKAEKEKKKKSKDKDLESKGGDRKKHKKDDESNLDAREIIERRKYRNKSDEFERDGDWHCANEVCRFINFQNNSNCKECGERKPDTPVFWDREMVRVLSMDGERRDRSRSAEKERRKKRNHNEDRESGHSDEYSEDDREKFGKEHIRKPEDKTYEDFEQVLERHLSDGDDTHKKGDSLMSDELSFSEADASMESEYAPTNLATNCSPPLQPRKKKTNVTSFLDDLPDDLSSDTGENLPFTTSSVSDEVPPHFTSVDTISSTDLELNSSIESSIGEEKNDLSRSPTRVQSELNEFEYSHKPNKDDEVFKKPEAKEGVKEEAITYDDFDSNAQDASDLIKCEKGGSPMINEGLDNLEGNSEGSQNCFVNKVREEAKSQDTDTNILDTDIKKELVTRDKCDESIEDCEENKLEQEMSDVKNKEQFDIDEAERKFAWKDRSRTSEEFELSLEINDDDFVQTVKEEHDTSSPRWENFRFQWDKEKNKVKQKVEEISKSSSLSLEKLEDIVSKTDKEEKNKTGRERSSRSSKSPKEESSVKEDSSQDEEHKQDSKEKNNSHREISVRKRMQDERIRQLSTESREKDSDKEDSVNKRKVINETTERVGDKGKDSRKHAKEDRRESENKDDKFKRSSEDGKKDDEKHRNYRRRVDDEDVKSPGKNLVRVDRERESGRGAKEDIRRKNDHKKSREEESSREKREKQEQSSNRSREDIGGQQKDDRRKLHESPHRNRDVSPSRQRGDERKHIGGQRQDTLDKRRDSSDQRMDSDERKRAEEERKSHNRGLNENKSHESSRKERYDHSHRKDERTNRTASPSQKRDDRADKILSPSQRRVERPDRSGSPSQRKDERVGTIGSPGRRREGRSDRIISPSLRRDERIDRIVSPSRRRDERVEKNVSPNVRRDQRPDRIASPNQRRDERSERIVKIPDRQERDHRTDRWDPVSQLSHKSERDEIKDKANRRDVLRDEDKREERDIDDRRDRKDERDKDDRRDKSERNIRDRDDRPGHDLERMKHKEQEHGVRNEKYRERVSERKNSRDAKEPQTEYITKTFEGSSQKKLHHEEPRSDVARKESKAKFAKNDSKLVEKTKGKKREVTIKSDQTADTGDNLETVKESKKVDEKTKVKDKLKQKDQDLRQILKMKQKEKLQGGKVKTKVAIAKKKMDKKKRRRDSSSSSSSSDSSSGSSDSSSDSESDSAEELTNLIAKDPKVLKKLIEALNKTKKKKGKKKKMKDKKPKMDAKAKEISKQIKMITSIENKRKVVMKKDKGMTMRINTSQEDASPEPSAVIQYEQEKKSKKRVRSTEKTPKKITKKIRATSDTNSSDENEDDEEVIQVNIQNSPAMRARQSKHSSRERSPSPKVRISKIKRRDSSASNASSVANKPENPVKKVTRESSPQPSRRPSAITDRSESQTSQDSTTTGMDTSACEELEEGEYRSASDVDEEIQAE